MSFLRLSTFVSGILAKGCRKKAFSFIRLHHSPKDNVTENLEFYLYRLCVCRELVSYIVNKVMLASYP